MSPLSVKNNNIEGASTGLKNDRLNEMYKQNVDRCFLPLQFLLWAIGVDLQTNCQATVRNKICSRKKHGKFFLQFHKIQFYC